MVVTHYFLYCLVLLLCVKSCLLALPSYSEIDGIVLPKTNKFICSNDLFLLEVRCLKRQIVCSVIITQGCRNNNKVIYSTRT